MTFKLFLFIALTSFVLNFEIFSQDVTSDNIVTKQIWLDYNPSYKLNEAFNLYGDIGARTVSPHEWNRYVIRPSIRYQLPKTIFSNLYYRSELHGGIGFFFTNNLSDVNRFEIRPFQGYKISWPNRPRIRIQHYLRLEERFDIDATNWVNTFGLRLRYQAAMVFFLKGDWLSFNNGIYLPVNVELFWNLIGVKQFNDAVRVMFGLGREFSPKWKGEVDIGYFYTRNTVEDVFATNDLALRIRVYYNF
ncbi:DUF2490 domain-containing protein [Carboxylicivirga sp. N1Y90]|uniref:DUF2490 domain-containing protein n=1 Tax=Carboxylicivirga fragile TaxID=3417571 RepID=UPI003D340076|nr:DUF2490 domain-containing protein [Marinilabiliaceae bacterium N1Y90]